MSNRIKNTGIFIACLILGLLISNMVLGCSEERAEVTENFPFELKVMPVPSELAVGETAELRISIETDGNYTGTKYALRYFQFEGEGSLRYDDDLPYLPNDSYDLPQKQFRLYYTSAASADHSFTIWISDNFGNERTLSFQFDPKD